MSQVQSEPRRGRGKLAIYGWDDMKVGEILTVSYRMGNSARVSAVQWAERRGNGARFSSRIAGDSMLIARIA